MCRLRHRLKILGYSRSSLHLTTNNLIQAAFVPLYYCSRLTGLPLSLLLPILSSHTEVGVRSCHFSPRPFCGLFSCWDLRILTVAAKALLHLTAVSWLISCLLHSVSAALASVLFQGHPGMFLPRTLPRCIQMFLLPERFPLRYPPVILFLPSSLFSKRRFTITSCWLLELHLSLLSEHCFMIHSLILPFCLAPKKM